eukprot:1156815-Pelagomonas_calceolata.AAC.7
MDASKGATIPRPKSSTNTFPTRPAHHGSNGRVQHTLHRTSTMTAMDASKGATIYLGPNPQQHSTHKACAANLSRSGMFRAESGTRRDLTGQHLPRKASTAS